MLEVHGVGLNAPKLMNITLPLDDCDVVYMEPAKQPANSYKKNNHDLAPKDRPYIALMTSAGRMLKLELSVIDSYQGLNSWNQNRRQRNESATYEHYTPNKPDTENEQKMRSASNVGEFAAAIRKAYQQLEIRLDRIVEYDIRKELAENVTLPPDFRFSQAHIVKVRSRQLLLTQANDGAIYYFSTRDLT